MDGVVTVAVQSLAGGPAGDFKNEEFLSRQEVMPPGQLVSRLAHL